MIGAIKLLEVKYVARGKKMHKHFENSHKLRIMFYSAKFEDLSPEGSLLDGSEGLLVREEPGCMSFATKTR